MVITCQKQEVDELLEIKSQISENKFRLSRSIWNWEFSCCHIHLGECRSVILWIKSLSSTGRGRWPDKPATREEWWPCLWSLRGAGLLKLE